MHSSDPIIPRKIKIDAVVPKGASVPISPGDVFVVASEIIRFARQFSADVTRRAEIGAQRDCALRQIESETALMREYIDRAFGERAEERARLHALMQAALASGNTEVFVAAVEASVSIVTSSPLTALAEFRQARASGQKFEI